MSKQTINIGASPNDGTGTPLRTSFDYTNQNFTEIYTALGGGVALPGATTQVIFNDGGTNLAGDAGLVYNKTTDALTVAGLVTAGSATITGNLTVDTNTFFVDSANNRVGIGTTSPAAGFGLEVAGNIRFQASVTGTDGTNTAIFGVNVLSAGVAGICSGTNVPLVFGVNSTEQMRLNSTGLGVGVTPAGTGGCLQLKSGITFPATQVASSDANTLDDYEEGTWVPTITGQVNCTAVTSVSAQYTKVGRLVTLSGYATASVTTANLVTYFALGSLPFTAAAVTVGSLIENASYKPGVSQVSGTTFYGFFSAVVQLTTGAKDFYYSISYYV